MEPEKVRLLEESLVRSPSSRGRQPWEFIVVAEPATLVALGRAKSHGSSFLAEAPLAVAILADPERCDVWVEDCSIAAILLQLTAQSLGLGSCWVQIRLREHGDGSGAEEYVRNLLDVPEGRRILAVVGLGYPDEVKVGHGSEDLPWGKIHRERYGRGGAEPSGGGRRG